MFFAAPCLYLASILLPGFAIARQLNIRNVLLRVSVAYGIGSSLVVLELFVYFLVLRLSFSPWLYGFVAVQTLAAATLIWLEKPVTANKTSRLWRPKEIVVGAVIALCVISAGLQASAKPPLAFDALSFWSLRSKLLLHDGHIDFNSQDALYLDAHIHRAYPWHSSLSEYWLRQLGGGEIAVNLVSFAYFLALVLALYAALSQRLDRLASLCLTGFFVSMPLILYHSYNANSDLILGYYVALSFVFFGQYLTEQRPVFLGVSAFFVGWGFFVKNDGLFFILAWLAALLAYSVLNRAAVPLRKYTAALWLILPLLPWLMFRMFFHLSLRDSPPAWGWHPEIFPQVWKALFLNNSWNVWWWLFLGLVIVRCAMIKARTEESSLWIFFCTALGLLLVMYTTSENYVYAVDGSALSRTFIPLLPMSILLAGSLLIDPAKKTSV